MLSGHTANLYNEHHLVVFGGENEAGRHLHELYVLDLKTLHWTCPTVTGPTPRGRGRHAATIWKDHLFITGGVTKDQEHVGDCCSLNLKTMTWSPPFTFIERFDHVSWVWGSRLWLFGGLNQKMERVGDISWIELEDLRHPVQSDPFRSQYSPPANSSHPTTISHSANTSHHSAHSSWESRVRTGSVSNVQFMSGPNVPSQIVGTHHHVTSGGNLLDFAIAPRAGPSGECGLMCLDLDALRWSRLAPKSELFDAAYQWHYCVTNHEGNRAWMLGCPSPNEDFAEETLSEVMEVDLRKFGLLGEQRVGRTGSSNGQSKPGHLGFLGNDWASVFEDSYATGGGTDFVVTGEEEDDEEESNLMASQGSQSGPPKAQADAESGTATPQPSSRNTAIHVHKIILHARWPHFRRLYNAQMAEFHTKKLHIPEPYGVVRAFLYYLYTDSVAHHDVHCPDVSTVAGLLVMANVYDMPGLNAKCVSRLSKELDVGNAAVIWERAGTAGEDWLRGRAATFILNQWGRVVRTTGFQNLGHLPMIELCRESDVEAKVVRGTDVDEFDGYASARLDNPFPTGPLLPGPEHAVMADEIDTTEDEEMV